MRPPPIRIGYPDTRMHMFFSFSQGWCNWTSKQNHVQMFMRLVQKIRRNMRSYPGNSEDQRWSSKDYRQLHCARWKFRRIGWKFTTGRWRGKVWEEEATKGRKQRRNDANHPGRALGWSNSGRSKTEEFQRAMAQWRSIFRSPPLW